MGVDYITDEVKALIGVEAPPATAWHPVEASEVRRFFQATMDPSPRYWQDGPGAGGRYGGAVAPLGFPVHAFRRPPDKPDPLDAMAEGDFDGLNRALRPGLPPVKVPLPRLLNGGYEYEFFRYARVGERILLRSRYKDIYQREGKGGAMVFLIIEDRYETAEGEPLLNAVNTIILR